MKPLLSVARLGLPLLILVIMTGCLPQERMVVLRLAHSLDTAHPVHRAMEVMDRRLQELSGDTMRIDIYPAGQLGNERELIELLQIGSLAMTKVSASPLEGFVPEMKVFNLPYIFRDTRHYHAALDSDVGRELLAAPTSVRLRGLGYYDAGARSFYTVDQPVHTPADLEGLKIRVQESPTALEMVASLSGAPTPIAWGELYTALQQGVVDGAENNLPSFYLSGHYEICKYFTLDEHTSVPDILLIGTPAWNALSQQQQKWLQRAVDDSVVYQRKLWSSESERALQAVVDAGVEIIRPDKSAFNNRVVGLRAAHDGTPLGDLLARIAALKTNETAVTPL
ncbi:TRAP transporter substrate-binding protein [Congregibacter litoralis]|uniref:Tripartite ATP-independent periplasmic transporter solute receptor, DctP family n=1 Tax=Congregibacter litoralis KT71 TaxID=314285 RepID=A4AC70_9GAMM|nr:TRAP transporter substrate-binding protein [Congregibacter litoralis]EAQ96298.2 tripartite ATP-independent periplasmic transporter solute receptor, DctP family [Congregibacter litoralis KT71]